VSPCRNAGNGGCLRSFRMIGIEIEKRNQFREQSAPILSQIEVREIETAHKSVVSPCRLSTVLATTSAMPKPRSTILPMLPIRLIILMNYYRKPKIGSDPNGYLAIGTGEEAEQSMSDMLKAGQKWLAEKLTMHASRRIRKLSIPSCLVPERLN